MPGIPLGFALHTNSAAIYTGPGNKKEERIVQRPNLEANREDQGKLINFEQVE